MLLVLLLVVVVAGGAIYYVKKHNNSTTTPSVTPTTTATSVTADLALAGSINLRQTDLPAGWTRAPAGQAPRPPVAPPASQVQADQALASCLGQPLAVVSGLFGNGALPGQQAAVRSPTFASGSDPNIQMYSTTAVLGTAAHGPAAAARLRRAQLHHLLRPVPVGTIAASVPGPPPRCRR